MDDEFESYGWRLEGPAYWTWVLVRLPFVIGILWVNINLWTLSPSELNAADVPPGVEDSLQALGEALEDGAGDEMQQLFPEGYVITHGIYGFANVDVALRSDDPKARDLALSNARWAVSQIDTEKGRQIFPETVAPRYGAFYRGYLAWLRGGILLAAPDQRPEEAVAFKRDCDEIAAAFREAETPYLPSYEGMAWPGDSVFLAASLALHDKLFESKYDDVLEGWVADVRRLRDPSSGMIPHAVVPGTGDTRITTRGLSAVLMSRMLWEVDPVLAAEEYENTREFFVTDRFGLIPGVLEYRKGTSGRGDVDSGPLIFGMSGSASVVGMAAARLHGDREFADPAFIASHAVGFPLGGRYMFGVLPVGEAFIVWAKTTTPWAGPAPMDRKWEPLMPTGWRLGWHAISLLLLVGLGLTEIVRGARALLRRRQQSS